MSKQGTPKIELQPLSTKDSICNQLHSLTQRYQCGEINESRVLDLITCVVYRIAARALGLPDVNLPLPKTKEKYYKIGEEWLRKKVRKK